MSGAFRDISLKTLVSFMEFFVCEMSKYRVMVKIQVGAGGSSHAEFHFRKRSTMV